eukprot:SAG22_NODE_637_length_8315_cov_16.174416_6_plen_226_part_00
MRPPPLISSSSIASTSISVQSPASAHASMTRVGTKPCLKSVVAEVANGKERVGRDADDAGEGARLELGWELTLHRTDSGIVSSARLLHIHHQQRSTRSVRARIQTTWVQAGGRGGGAAHRPAQFGCPYRRPCRPDLALVAAGHQVAAALQRVPEEEGDPAVTLPVPSLPAAHERCPPTPHRTEGTKEGGNGKRRQTLRHSTARHGTARHSTGRQANRHNRRRTNK